MREHYLLSSANLTSRLINRKLIMQKIVIMVIVGFAEVLITGCRATGRVATGKIDFLELELTGDWVANEEITAICGDGGRTLLLSSSGTRILALDWERRRVDTIPLTTRVTPPLGIAADRDYIYVYNDRELYRLAKNKWTMEVWLNNIRVTGLVVYAPGEMLVSDKERQVVWLKRFFGESRVFLDRGDNIIQPGAIAAFPDGTFGILVGSAYLFKVNRAGIVLDRIKIPIGINLLVAGRQGQTLLMRRGEPVIWSLQDSNIKGYKLSSDVRNPTGLAVVENRIAVLDNGIRVAFYAIPDR